MNVGDVVYWREYDYIYRGTVVSISDRSGVTMLKLKDVATRQLGYVRWFSQKGENGRTVNEKHVETNVSKLTAGILR